MTTSTIYPEIRVVAIGVFNPDGKLLLGLRKDSEKWTAPGGHLEDGETPIRGAVRELYEETGLVPKHIRQLGDGLTVNEEGVTYRVFCFKAEVDSHQLPTGENDPDNECEHWDWVDVSLGSLPLEYRQNLFHPNDILLKYLGLQCGVIHEDLDLPVDTVKIIVEDHKAKPESIEGTPGYVFTQLLNRHPEFGSLVDPGDIEGLATLINESGKSYIAFGEELNAPRHRYLHEQYDPIIHDDPWLHEADKGEELSKDEKYAKLKDVMAPAKQEEMPHPFDYSQVPGDFQNDPSKPLYEYTSATPALKAKFWSNYHNDMGKFAKEKGKDPSSHEKFAEQHAKNAIHFATQLAQKPLDTAPPFKLESPEPEKKKDELPHPFDYSKPPPNMHIGEGKDYSEWDKLEPHKKASEWQEYHSKAAQKAKETGQGGAASKHMKLETEHETNASYLVPNCKHCGSADHLTEEHEDDKPDYDEADTDSYNPVGWQRENRGPNKPTGPLGEIVLNQINAHEPNSKNLEYLGHGGDSPLQKALNRKALDGALHTDDLYRSYKNTPHAPSSLLLKYIVHRVNNLKGYEDPKKAERLDKDFMALHQFGGAKDKNGHMRPSDLHWLLHKNPQLIDELAAQRNRHQKAIASGIGLNVRNINGEPYVALTRGLHSEKMAHEHALSSFADSKDPGFGSHKHHTWVPLRDIWYSYDLGSKYPKGQHGAEDEFLVSHNPKAHGHRFKASQNDVSQLSQSFKDDTTQGPLGYQVKNNPAINATGRQHWQDIQPNEAIDPVEHAPKLTSSTDEDLVNYLKNKQESGDLGRAEAFEAIQHSNAGPKTWDAVANYLSRQLPPKMPDTWLPSKAVPAPVVMGHIERPGGSYDAIYEGLKNPNLTPEHIDKALDLLQDSRDYRAGLHYAAKNTTPEKANFLFNKLDSDKSRGTYKAGTEDVKYPAESIVEHMSVEDRKSALNNLLNRDYSDPNTLGLRVADSRDVQHKIVYNLRLAEALLKHSPPEEIQKFVDKFPNKEAIENLGVWDEIKNLAPLSQNEIENFAKIAVGRHDFLHKPITDTQKEYIIKNGIKPAVAELMKKIQAFRKDSPSGARLTPNEQKEILNRPDLELDNELAQIPGLSGETVSKLLSRHTDRNRLNVIKLLVSNPGLSQQSIIEALPLDARQTLPFLFNKKYKDLTSKERKIISEYKKAHPETKPVWGLLTARIRTPSAEKGHIIRPLPASEQLGKNEGLQKGIPGLLVGAMLSGSPAQALPAESAPQEHHVKSTWNNTGLNPEMHPIAQLESSNGILINHTPSPKGPFYTAYGALGFKPSTAFEEFQTSPRLQKKYPVKDQNEFYHHFTTNPVMYKDLANQHWMKLKRLSGMVHPQGAAFLWHWGQNKPITPEVLQSDEYASKYRDMYQPQMASKSEDDLNKMAIADIKQGKPTRALGDWKEFDYSHLLPDRNKYKLTVAHEEGDPGRSYVRAKLQQLQPSNREVGEITATHWPHNKTIQLGSSVVEQAHRGKGLGQAMYEAVLAHALNHLGAAAATGGTHSTLAMKAHKKLAAKHGMDYRPKKNKSAWADPVNETGEFDEKYAPYKYTLKNEDLEKKILDPNLGITFQHQHHALDVGNNDISHTAITAHLPSGEKIGETLLHHLPNGTLESEGTNVHPEHQRKGIASAIYNYAQKVTGKKVIPSSDQTPAGKALWSSFGKSEDGNPTPIGIKVPKGGSNCAKCIYSDDGRCTNKDYIAAEYLGKKFGDDKFIDGKTGKEVPGNEFCCNFFDWEPKELKKIELSLAKGAMQRIAPFNPQKQQLPSPQVKRLDEWQSGYSNMADREAAPTFESGAARIRALHKLASNTKARRNPKTGKVEYLLHRGMSVPEIMESVGKANVNHTKTSSWTPDIKIANEFAEHHTGERPANTTLHDAVISAWVPHDKIRLIPKQYGNLSIKGAAVAPPKGSNFFTREHEVIVEPNHNSELATHVERFEAHQPHKTTQGMINARLLRNAVQKSLMLRKGIIYLNKDKNQYEHWITTDNLSDYVNDLHKMHERETGRTIPDASKSQQVFTNTTEKIHLLYGVPESADQGLAEDESTKILKSAQNFEGGEIPTKTTEVSRSEEKSAMFGLWWGISPSGYGLRSSGSFREDKASEQDGSSTVYLGKSIRRNTEVRSDMFKLSSYQNLQKKAIFSQEHKDNLVLSNIRAQIGFSPHLNNAFKAAQFLTGGKPLTHEEARKHLWDCDGDYVAAALKAYNLQDTEENRKAIAAHTEHQDEISKSEDGKQTKLTEAYAELPEAKGTADAINRAIKSDNIKPIELGGKHTSGSLVAQDPETSVTLLLKPNAGGVSKAAGVDEEQASQAKREGCWWQCAKLFGLEGYFPQAQTVILRFDDNSLDERASVIMLPPDWVTAEKVKEADPNWLIRVTDHYRPKGVLHQWAVIDLILGNVDRHLNNALVKHTDIMLIDQGSAFAGKDFNPGHDENSFVPFYLRTHYVGKKFRLLDPEMKLSYMPEAGEQADKMLIKWVRAIDANRLAEVIQRYGINSKPTIERLKKVQALEGNFSSRINQMWIGV